ncbi:hypothetical protein OAA67_04380 [Winogradskyella sp.]|nr:hypothetical protein [Winogradskyella sp.]
MSQIHLYTTFYNEKNQARLEELVACIRNNSLNPEISSITVFNEGSSVVKYAPDKITEIKIKKRPTYDDFVQHINAVTKPNDIHIIANTDIFFDENISVVKSVLDHNCCFALSRWDTTETKKPKLYNHNDSQDVWIFKGTIHQDLNADFPLGVPRCDNRLLYEIECAGYTVLNPAFSIKSYHIHKGQRALVYTEHDNVYKIPPPYRYTYPHNLYGFWQTLYFNYKHQEKLGAYCYDIKKVNFWWPVRLLRKTLEVLTRKKMPLIGYN